MSACADMNSAKPRLIVQLPLSNGWGTEAEIAARDELATALRDGFHAHGYGRFRGIEDGVGKANLVLSIRPFDDLDALPEEYIRAELRARGLLDKAMIAIEAKSSGTDGGPQTRYIVLWPEGHTGEFDLG
ncbi:MAG TPA: hypothetical protein VHR66_05000 [Gemmataceae bacterium]|jgi:hypothetical protein|nr:hypothetical protein [Gemmataceae bacterium]